MWILPTLLFVTSVIVLILLFMRQIAVEEFRIQLRELSDAKLEHYKYSKDLNQKGIELVTQDINSRKNNRAESLK